MDRPLSVAIGIVLYENKILLLSRPSGTYEGMWGLPGGKIEGDEFVADAAVREVHEETGLRTSFARYDGIVSELILHKGVVEKHFILHRCILHTASLGTSQQDGEGEPCWFEVDILEHHKQDIIPSDYNIVQEFLAEQHRTYIECQIERVDTTYKLVRWS